MRNPRKIILLFLLHCFCVHRQVHCLPASGDNDHEQSTGEQKLPSDSNVEERLYNLAVSDKKPSTDNGKEIGHKSSCVGPGEKQGSCEHVRKCLQEEYQSNLTHAANYVCTIENTYVGICCLNPSVDPSTQTDELSSVLPTIAADKNGIDSVRIVWPDHQDIQDIQDARDPRRSRGCGMTARSKTRLVGGRPADPSEWPWMAALLRKDASQYCGGVLITDRHVLTAAHCVYRFKARDIGVRLGEYDFSTSEETRAQDFAVSEIRVHRDFDYTSYENDIAIVKIHRPTVFNTYIWPVCLPPIEQTFENKTAIVTGWGTRYYGGPASTVLMEVAVPIWPQDRCVRSFTQRIPRTAMCAGGYEGGSDACQGDSGGPLLHQLGNGRWVNVGIVSWGIRCGEPGHPGIYTRVNSYLDWIFANAVF